MDTGKKGGSGARAKSTTDSRWRFYAGIVAVVAAAGAVGGAWFVKRKAADSVEATSSTDGPAPSSRHVERGLSALRQGQANAVPAERYELSYTFTSSQQAKPFMDFSVQGSLDLADATVAASALPELRGAANGETMLQGRFRGRVGLSQLGTRDSSDTLSRLQSDFEKPFYAKFAKSGQLVRMYFSPGVERLVQTSWRAFMSAAQHVVPQGDSRAAGTWQVEESDSAGRYLAEYSQEYVGSLLQVNKTKLQYRALSSGVNHRIERFSQAAGFVASEMPPAGRSLDMTSLRSLEYSEKSVASAIGAVSIDITGETRVSLAHAWVVPRLRRRRQSTWLLSVMREAATQWKRLPPERRASRKRYVAKPFTRCDQCRGRTWTLRWRVHCCRVIQIWCEPRLPTPFATVLAQRC